MRKVWLTIALLSITVVAGVAQPTQVAGGQRIAWDQDAPTLADAQGATFKYYPDGSATGVALTSVTCTGTASPFVCSALFPPFTPGNHSITITATNIAGESSKSSPFAFNFVVTLGAPRNVRIGGTIAGGGTSEIPPIKEQ